LIRHASVETQSDGVVTVDVTPCVLVVLCPDAPKRPTWRHATAVLLGATSWIRRHLPVPVVAITASWSSPYPTPGANIHHPPPHRNLSELPVFHLVAYNTSKLVQKLFSRSPVLLIAYKYLFQDVASVGEPKGGHDGLAMHFMNVPVGGTGNVATGCSTRGSLPPRSFPSHRRALGQVEVEGPPIEAVPFDTDFNYSVQYNFFGATHKNGHPDSIRPFAKFAEFSIHRNRARRTRAPDESSEGFRKPCVLLGAWLR
jgi:hypothetical protein